MTEQELRETIRTIRGIFNTPISVIAKEIGIHQSLVTRFINDNMQVGVRPSEHLLKSLENWCNTKIRLFKEQLGGEQ